MGKLLDYLFGKKEQVHVPEQPALEETWLSSNFGLRWITRLQDWGVSTDEYRKEKKKTDEETVLALFKMLVVRHKREPLVLQSLYYELAMIQAELGKDPKPYLRLAHASILKHYRQSGNVRAVVIQNAGRDSCRACKKLDGWALTLAQAAKKRHLPHAKCTKKHGKAAFCRCTYGPMTELR